MPPPLIRLQSVTKRFDASTPPVLAPFDLDIAPGEFVSILGP